MLDLPHDQEQILTLKKSKSDVVEGYRKKFLASILHGGMLAIYLGSEPYDLIEDFQSDDFPFDLILHYKDVRNPDNYKKLIRDTDDLSDYGLCQAGANDITQFVISAKSDKLTISVIVDANRGISID